MKRQLLLVNSVKGNMETEGRANNTDSKGVRSGLAMTGQLSTPSTRSDLEVRSVEPWLGCGGCKRPTSPKSGVVLFVFGASRLRVALCPLQWFTTGRSFGVAAAGFCGAPLMKAYRIQGQVVKMCSKPTSGIESSSVLSYGVEGVVSKEWTPSEGRQPHPLEIHRANAYS